MPFHITPNLTYHYQLSGEGPSLLLLHGFTGSAQNWQPLMDSLGGSYQLIAVDLPGHGLSDAPPNPAAYTMPSVARDIDALLQHLGAERVHLLGYSMGGRLALYLALNDPHRWRSLVLESASPGLRSSAAREERAVQDEALADFVEQQGIRTFVNRWEALPLFASQQRLPPALREAHRNARLRNRPAGLANSLRGMGTGVQPSLWERLGELALPVLLIAGSSDEKFVTIARRMSMLLPRARLAIVPDAGHTVHLEQPARYSSLLRGWLNELA